jgi:hypothetical protein
LGGGLAMCTNRGGALAGRRSESLHGVRIACRVGVVRKPRNVVSGSRIVREGGQRSPVERPPSAGRNRVLEREPRQLVPERDSVAVRGEHPRCKTQVERSDVTRGEELEQP